MIKTFSKYYSINKTTKEEVNIQKVCSFEAAPMFDDLKKIFLIHHPGFVNILNLQFTPKSSDQSEDELIITYEKMKNDTLMEPLIKYFKSKGKNCEIMNPTIRNKIIFGVASTINFCYEKKIPFKELNPSNIYLDEYYEPRISIGYSIYVYTNLLITCVYKYAIFMPPEHRVLAFEDEKYSVYQFGIFLYYMFCPNIRLYQKTIKKRDSIPDVYWDLIQQCTNETPKERPTIRQIIKELKNDKYLLKEFGLESNPNEVHLYQEKMEKRINFHF